MIKEEFLKLQAAGRIYWGAQGTAIPSVIRFLNEVDGLVPWTWWPHDEVGHTDEARKEIQDIFGTQTAFDTPKPIRLMERVLQVCAPEKDALVLDFFAGSGTTAHALLKMNKEDGGDRRFVMVSSKENTDEQPNKNLARDILAGRLKSAVMGYTSSRFGPVAGLGGSFAYVKATPVPMHRLEEGLTDDMVWAFALQATGHPLASASSPLSVSVDGTSLVAYVGNTKPSTLAALQTVLEGHKGSVVVLSWAPQAVAEHLGELEARVSLVALPGDLQRAFKQGNAAPRKDIELPATEAVLGDAA